MKRFSPASWARARLDRAAPRLVGGHLVHAGLQGRAGRVAGAGAAQRVLVALEVRAPDRLQLGQRHVDHLGVAEHLREFVGAEREILGGVRPLRLEPVGEALHRPRRLARRLVELGLERRIGDRGEGGLAVLGIIFGEAAEAGLAVIDEAQAARESSDWRGSAAAARGTFFR